MATIMSGKGLSQRSIGAVLGVDQSTVQRDLAAGDTNESPEESAAATSRQYLRDTPRARCPELA
jgi:predicted transcriptional regulator